MPTHKGQASRPGGLLQPLDIPVWKWDRVSMDFIDSLSRSRLGHDSLWVIVDRLTKSAHFILVRSNRTIPLLAKLYVKGIIKLHRVPTSIVSDRDPLFTSGFWKGLQKALGTKLNFSTAYHPQADGQIERVNQTLEDLLRACVLDFGGSWEDHTSTVEFSYNNSFQSSIGMAPFEALYGRPCRSYFCWLEAGEKLILDPDFIRGSTEKIDLIRHRMIEIQSRQKSYADNRRRNLEFSMGDLMFIHVSPMKGLVRFSQSGKLAPRYNGQFPITECIGFMAYRLLLPAQFSAIHDVSRFSTTEMP